MTTDGTGGRAAVRLFQAPSAVVARERAHHGGRGFFCAIFAQKAGAVRHFLYIFAKKAEKNHSSFSRALACEEKTVYITAILYK